MKFKLEVTLDEMRYPVAVVTNENGDTVATASLDKPVEFTLNEDDVIGPSDV